MAAELGQLPFTADKAESLYEAVLASFQSMADDRSQVIGKLESLLTTEGYYAET